MQKITPNLWFDGNAKQAVDYYLSVFPDGKVVDTQYYPDSAEEGLADFQLDKAGQVLTIDFEIFDLSFVAINAGPEFKFTPAQSLTINFLAADGKTETDMDQLWTKLSDGGQVLMPLQKYDFSTYYGWVQDKYGLSWQLMYIGADEPGRAEIIPSLLFGGPAQNRAFEAIEYYTSIFPDSQVGATYPYDEVTGPAEPEALAFADFSLAGQQFIASDSGVEQDFTFNEAVSFAVSCKDQAEIDYYWERLSAVPESEQCGWCKDKFGVSWQIVPADMAELMQKPGAYSTMMQQKKIVIADY